MDLGDLLEYQVEEAYKTAKFWAEYEDQVRHEFNRQGWNLDRCIHLYEAENLTVLSISRYGNSIEQQNAYIVGRLVGSDDNDNNDKFSASLKPTYMDPAGRCYIVTADGVKLENKRERRFQHLLNNKNWLMIIFIIFQFFF